MTNAPRYPCRGCPNRYPACSDHCNKYQVAKAIDKRRRKFQIEQSINSYQATKSCRMTALGIQPKRRSKA